MKGKAKKLGAQDRSMDPDAGNGSRVFFFPKRNPPISVRAKSQEEAEAQLPDEPTNQAPAGAETNPQEA